MTSSAAGGAAFVVLCSAACDPVLNVAGSFFPAWMVAMLVGIAPQVSGPIVDLRVVDNQHVSQGELLFAIDCRPYEARLARARADLALALKGVDAQRKAIASAGSEVGRREASLASATAQLT